MWSLYLQNNELVYNLHDKDDIYIRFNAEVRTNVISWSEVKFSGLKSADFKSAEFISLSADLDRQ